MRIKSLLFPVLTLGLGGAWLRRQQRAPQAQEDLSGKAALVTGASTGIGRAIAETLAEAGMQVFASVRKKSDAESLDALGIRPILFDVTDYDSIQAAASEVQEALNGKALYALVNNAGVAVGGPLEKLPREDLRWQFEVNVFGLMDVTQALMPLMQGGGKIVNISSIGGVTTQPFIGAYSASKHALEALSDALRKELLMTGSQTDVIVIQPGNIRTPIWDKADEIDLEAYAGTPYYELGEKIKRAAVSGGQNGEPPERVAEYVLGALGRSQNPARYIVSGNWPQEVLLPRALPDRWLDRLTKKVLWR